MRYSIADLMATRLLSSHRKRLMQAPPLLRQICCCKLIVVLFRQIIRSNSNVSGDDGGPACFYRNDDNTVLTQRTRGETDAGDPIGGGSGLKVLSGDTGLLMSSVQGDNITVLTRVRWGSGLKVVLPPVLVGGGGPACFSVSQSWPKWRYR